MVVCSYFQRGMCHFGDKCRNEHISPYSYRADTKPNEIRVSVVAEAETILQGNQWILSCFAPFRDKLGITIPGFIDDLSQEELRWECYQAKGNGTLPQHVQGIRIKVDEAKQKLIVLKSGSTEVINYLVDLYHGNGMTNRDNPFLSSFSRPSSGFGTIANSSLFATPSSFGNPFNQSQVLQNPHDPKTSQPHLQTSQPNSLFSLPPAFNAQKSPFTFAIQQASEANAAANLAVGQSIKAANTLAVGQPTNGGQNVNTPFGSNTLFGKSVPFSSNIFGQPVTSNSMTSSVGQPATYSLFETKNNAFSFGAHASVNPDAVRVTDNPFLLPTTSKFPNNEYLMDYSTDHNVYSDPNDLTEEDIEAFKSDKFYLGKVPTKPPSKEFCSD